MPKKWIHLIRSTQILQQPDQKLEGNLELKTGCDDPIGYQSAFSSGFVRVIVNATRHRKHLLTEVDVALSCQHGVVTIRLGYRPIYDAQRNLNMMYPNTMSPIDLPNTS